MNEYLNASEEDLKAVEEIQCAENPEKEGCLISREFEATADNSINTIDEKPLIFRLVV